MGRAQDFTGFRNRREDDPMRTTVSTATNGDRDPGGRFIPGNKAARGRRANIAERAAELRGAMSGAVTPDDLRDIVEALLGPRRA